MSFYKYVTIYKMPEKESLVQKFSNPKSFNKIFVAVLIMAILIGAGTGFALAATGKNDTELTSTLSQQGSPKQAQQDTKTFRDFAKGKIAKKSDPKPGQEYGEGTHTLVREAAVPVALTSSVVDLNKYEGKKVKVFGETQKAVKEGWLMDVGRVEEEKE